MSNVSSPLAAAQVSRFRNSFDSTPIADISLQVALDGIGNGAYESDVKRVRHALARYGKSAYNRAKASLQAVTFGGTFAPSRGITHLLHHSGIAHGDLDHLDISKLMAAKRAICADPRTVYVFISPSGTGLKVGVHVPIVGDDAAYKHAWLTVAAEYERLYTVPWDPSGKDICRLCFMSYDPDLYWNPEAALFDVPPVPAPEPRPSTPKRYAPVPYQADRHRAYAERAIRTATEMIQNAPMGTRHHTRLRAARLLGGYVAGGVLSDEEAYGALAQALVGHTEDLKRALDTMEDGLKYGQAHPISLHDLEAERQAWLDQHVKSRPRQPSPAVSPPVNPWDGRNTLPLRPFARHRGIQIRGRRVHDG